MCVCAAIFWLCLWRWRCGDDDDEASARDARYDDEVRLMEVMRPLLLLLLLCATVCWIRKNTHTHLSH